MLNDMAYQQILYFSVQQYLKKETFKRILGKFVQR